MLRLLRFVWKLFILASVFGIGYIIGREHSFEEDEDWDEEDFEEEETPPAAGKPEAAGEKKEVTFEHADEKATSVSVVGDFNDWNKDTTPMAKENDVWKCRVALAPGRHEYKFVINNTDWIIDPKSAEKVPDKYGSESSLLVVS